MYDIFFVGTENQDWYLLKSKFPFAKLVSSVEQAKHLSLTTMFWVVWDNITLADNFVFNHVATKWDSNYIHVFKNGNHFDGICLFPKHASFSKRELDYRFFTNKKEIDIVASIPKPYDTFTLKSYDDYLNAIKVSKTKMFWAIWDDILLSKDFNFDYQVPAWDHRYTHIFKNGECFDGICLFSKNTTVSKREFDCRFFTEKKEIDIVASYPNSKPFDLVFISYNEPNADENFKRLLKKIPTAKRVDKVKGIHNAHIKAASLVETPMFWVVDGDAVILEDFNFDYQVESWNRDTVHVWKSRNTINDLEYGYGGVKLLPTKLTMQLDVNAIDMTTSISSKFRPVNRVSNVTAFNTDPFSTWRSAFRECAKLVSRSIVNQVTEETQQRLNIWLSVGRDKLYAEYAIAGALAGKTFAETFPDQLSMINNFEWLENKFKESQIK